MREAPSASGRYCRFPIPGARHIHAKVFRNGQERLTTQLYRAGYPQNEADFLFRSMSPEEQRRATMVIEPLPAGDRPQWETEIQVVLPTTA